MTPEIWCWQRWIEYNEYWPRSLSSYVKSIMDKVMDNIIMQISQKDLIFYLIFIFYLEIIFNHILFVFFSCSSPMISVYRQKRPIIMVDDKNPYSVLLNREQWRAMLHGQICSLFAATSIQPPAATWQRHIKSRQADVRTHQTVHAIYTYIVNMTHAWVIHFSCNNLFVQKFIDVVCVFRTKALPFRFDSGTAFSS